MITQKPFFKSCLYCSSDPGTIPDALMRGFNVVVLVDVEESNQYPACFPISTLLPPYALVAMIINTDRNMPDYEQTVQSYLQLYYNFLAAPQQEVHIVNLLASMYKTNKNVLIYAEYDVEKQFYPLFILTNFFLNQFGINILPYESLFMTNEQPPIFNPQPEFIYRIVELLFTNAYISKEEYSVLLPVGSIPSPRSIQILLSDYNYSFPTMEVAITAACNIIDSYKRQAQTGMYCPVIQLTKTLDEARQQQIQQVISNSNTMFGKHSITQIQDRNPIVGNLDSPK